MEPCSLNMSFFFFFFFGEKIYQNLNTCIMLYIPEGMPDAEVVVAPAGVSSEESAGEPTGGFPLAPASP